ncbi:UrcA family protein [Altererythrobacter atlanticus]|uniref:Uncharacterized protein n=1 Tax=Croceibacterium atlanticum TaxID=1267766 RepID=A0A0F7KWB7_9SPHN|nr:UrcA family protein [Croceibacterium atlanticum]AKH43080.1 hypothetical protein WYH_02046 [Croceibacterium atlanticum]MBB5732216.1 UrcA family protein [Croceibacterium atlanticum]
MRRLLSATLAAAFLAGAAAPATAEDLRIRIDLGQLDIANPADVEAIKDRIEIAVSRACAEAVRFPAEVRSIADCKADGTAKAFAEVDARRALVAAN